MPGALARRLSRERSKRTRSGSLRLRIFPVSRPDRPLSVPISRNIWSRRLLTVPSALPANRASKRRSAISGRTGARLRISNEDSFSSSSTPRSSAKRSIAALSPFSPATATRGTSSFVPFPSSTRSCVSSARPGSMLKRPLQEAIARPPRSRRVKLRSMAEYLSSPTEMSPADRSKRASRSARSIPPGTSRESLASRAT